MDPGSHNLSHLRLLVLLGKQVKFSSRLISSSLGLDQESSTWETQLLFPRGPELNQDPAYLGNMEMQLGRM